MAVWLLTALVSERASAQAGLVDPAWPSVLTVNYRQLIAEPDGGLLAVAPLGPFGSTGVGGPVATHLLPDGRLDPDFHYDLIVAAPNDEHIAVLQADGKILIHGSKGFDFSPIFRRLNADGTIDETFNPGTSWTGSSVRPGHIIVNPDGQIFLDGAFQKYQGRELSKPVRLTPTGDYDPGFAAGDDPLIGCSAMADAGDQRIYAARFNNGIFPRPYGLVRLTSSGDTDPAFAPVVTDNLIQQIFVLPDGDLIIAGWFASVNGEPSQSIARISSDGTVLDLAPLPPDWSSAYALHGVFSDGGLLVEIKDRNSYPILRRLQPDGQPDPEWGKGSLGLWHPFYNLAAAVGPDDRVFVNFTGTVTAGITTRLTDNSYVAPKPPAILVQPSGTNMLLGGELRLTVTVTGDGPFTFYWNNESGDVGGPSSDPVLVINPFSLKDVATYYVIVVGPGGFVSSEAARVVAILPIQDLRIDQYGVLKGAVPTIANHGYAIDVSPTPDGAAWTVQQTYAGNGELMEISLPITGQQGFYRVRVL